MGIVTELADVASARVTMRGENELLLSIHTLI
jgi:hypothetical protein